MEADLVKRAGVPFAAIPAAGVHGVGLRALPGNLWRLGRGLWAAYWLLRRFHPDVMFFTGGYVAVPVAAASKIPGARRPRILLFVPDIEPGLALKTLARFADQIAVSVEESYKFFPSGYRSRITVTGYPVRPELASWDLEAARRKFDLDPSLPVLLVVGGSLGAKPVNRALTAALPDLLAEMQVIHLCGRLDWPEVETMQKTLPAGISSRYHPYPYLHSEEMGAALAAASLWVGRAGASILGELPLFGLPAVLIPYPYAWRYQKVNAAFLEGRGAGVIVEDADLPARLLPVVRRLVHEPGMLEHMAERMRSLAQPHAAQTLAGLLNNLTAPTGGGKS